MTQPVIIAALILGAAIIIGAFVFSGRYISVAVTSGDRLGYVIVIDKFTGAKTICYAVGCQPLVEKDAK